MLTKLLKYDLKHIYKRLVIFYSLAIFFAILTRIFFEIENSIIINIIAQVLSGVTISMMANCLINNIMGIWVRFKHNLYGDESYLTHTLPVTKNEQYFSKILTAAISLFTTFAIIAATLFVAYYSQENIEMLKILLSSLGDFFESSPILIIASLLFILFLEMLSAVQCGFTGLIIGNKMNNAKLGFSVLFGFIAYIASQILAVLGIFLAGLFNDKIMQLFTSSTITEFSIIKTVIILAAGIYTALFFVGLAVNLKLFKKGVNVD